MGLVVVTPPTVEPLSIAEASAHLRLDVSNAEPAPDACTPTLVVSAGSVTAGAHRYAVTFVTDDGETQGGTQSAAVTTTTPAGQVALSNIPTGGSLVTARKIYRTLAGGTAYKLLTTISNNVATTYTDNTADTALGALMPTRNTTGDSYLSALIVAAREYCETKTNRALITQALRVTCDRLPTGDVLALPRPALQSVESVTYLDSAGASQTLPTTVYSVDTGNIVGRITRNYAKIWPVTYWQRNAVTIDYTAGFGDAASDVPSAIVHAMKMLVAHWYSTRETFVTARFALEVPFSVDALLGVWRVPEIA